MALLLLSTRQQLKQLHPSKPPSYFSIVLKLQRAPLEKQKAE
jgi:hypothetical protein